MEIPQSVALLQQVWCSGWSLIVFSKTGQLTGIEFFSSKSPALGNDEQQLTGVPRRLTVR
jgi:hypothetical protein